MRILSVESENFGALAEKQKKPAGYEPAGFFAQGDYLNK